MGWAPSHHRPHFNSGCSRDDVLEWLAGVRLSSGALTCPTLDSKFMAVFANVFCERRIPFPDMSVFGCHALLCRVSWGRLVLLGPWTAGAVVMSVVRGCIAPCLCLLLSFTFQDPGVVKPR